MRNIPATTGNAEQTAGGIWLVETASDAKELLNELYTVQPVAIDTETVGVNPKKQSPVGRGRVVCWSLAYRINNQVKRVFLWWTPEIVEVLKPWLEDELCLKVGHNIWTFDKHVIKNMGVDLKGIIADSSRNARLWKTDKRFKVGLKVLMYQLFGYELGKLEDLFSRRKGLKIETRETIGKSWRKINGDKVPTTLGLCWQNVSWAKKGIELIPLDEITTRYPERTNQLYDYASLDAKGHYEVYEYLLDKVPEKLSTWWNTGLEAWHNMERRGITIDAEKCKQVSELARQEAAKLLPQLQAWNTSGEEVKWTSPKSLSKFLFEYKNLPIPKVTGSRKAVKINREKAKSTSQASLEWLAANSLEGENLKLLLRYRELLSDATRVGSYPSEVSPLDGRLHSVMAPTCDTGRGTSKNPALQQIPSGARDKLGIRKCFIPSPGNKLVVADYSQLELYVLAHYMIKWCNNSNLYDALIGGDVHSWVAKEAWPWLKKYPGNLNDHPGKPKKARSDVKNVVYGINYGKTETGLGASILDENGKPIGKAAAKELLDTVINTLGVSPVHEKLKNFALQNGFVKTIAGRKRPLPEVFSRNKWEVRAALRQALNSPIQGGAADIVQQAMINCEADNLPLVLQIHDELVLDVPADCAQDYADRLVKAMTSNMFDLRVNLSVDCHIVDSWGEAK